MRGRELHRFVARPTGGGRRARLLVIAAVIFATTGLRAGPLQAQARPGVVSGVIRSESGRLLENALVMLDPDALGPRTNTDAAGRFQITRVRSGDHVLRVLHVGFAALDSAISVPRAGLEVIVTMRPIANLDTLRIVAREAGVHGTVISRAGFTPIDKADVSLVGTRIHGTTDPDGRFNFPAAHDGAYMIVAKARGMQMFTLPVVIPADSAVEVALVMDSMSAPGGKLLALPLAAFEHRMRSRLLSKSALVVRQELAGRGSMGLADALRFAPSFMRTGMRIFDTACIYVDGIPRPYMTANDILAADVDAVEIYGPGSIEPTELREWPHGIPCGNPYGTGGVGQSELLTGLQPGARSMGSRGGNLAWAIVVWLKR